jgi:biopolymer transport protein ExbD
MQLRKNHCRHAEIDMAPLIDMVFLLLIFFMCAATMSSIQFTPDVELPVADKAQVPEEVEQMQDRGIINILPATGADDDGRFFVLGTEVEEADLVDIMRERAKKNPNIKLYLRADRDVPFRMVKKALRACAEAGISDVIFGAFQSPSQ